MVKGIRSEKFDPLVSPQINGTSQVSRRNVDAIGLLAVEPPPPITLPKDVCFSR